VADTPAICDEVRASTCVVVRAPRVAEVSVFRMVVVISPIWAVVRAAISVVEN